MKGEPACSHPERVDGVCTACGHCVHELIINGVCHFCGSADIDGVALSPKPGGDAVIAPDRLVRRREP